MSSWLFKLRGDIDGKQKIVLGIIGALFLLIFWALLTAGENPVLPRSVFPHPMRVLNAFGDL
ncbi:MAG: hypothetical protein IPO92_12725 [Saprospiraceae bacterium]|nr:hypothetical protein [Saprospiraceae bacterium]